VPQPYQPGSDLLSVNGSIRSGVLTDVLLTLGGIYSGLGLAILFEDPALLLGALPGGSRFNVDIRARALPPAGMSSQVYRGKISYTKKLLWFINITANLTNESFNNPINLSLDTYPGGQYELFNLNNIDFFDDYDGDGDSSGTSQFWADIFNATIGNGKIEIGGQESFNFIPTTSALDVGSGNSQLFNGDYLAKYNASMPPVGSRAIPFHNFTTSFDLSGNNEEHISFNKRNGDWLAVELDATALNEDIFDCTFICDFKDWEITGQDTFCDSAIFSVPAGAPAYNWSYPGVITTPDPSQPNVIEVQAWNDGYHTLSVNFGKFSKCDITAADTRIGKVVYTGVPIPGGNLILDDPNYILYLQPGDDDYCEIVGVRIINWPHLEQVQETEMRKVSGNAYWDGPMRNGRNFSAAIFPDCNETFVFEIRAKNECGWSEWEEFSVELDVCDSNCSSTPPQTGITSPNFIIFPNPADDYMRISKVTNPTWEFPECDDNGNQVIDNGSGSNCIYYVLVTIYDWNGTQVLQGLYELGTQVDVSGLQAGTHIMHISMGSQMEQHQIIIE
jgi:hypothetical protein